MKLIQSIYKAYYKNEEEIKNALSVMSRLYEDWDYQLIEKATIKFIETDSKGFPPVPGQILTLAKEIRKSEWEQRKREQDALPEPEIKIAPMPEETKERLRKMGWNG